MITQADMTLSQRIDNLLSHDMYAFSLSLLATGLLCYAEILIKSALNRLTIKGRIISVYKSYYLIISTQNSSNGLFLSTFFLDRLMENIERLYYKALLKVTSFYGMSHQQAQDFYVITSFPVLRTYQKKGIRIQYLSKKDIPETLQKAIKTEMGYLKILNQALTACGLIQFEKRVCGINQVSAVLNELAESIHQGMFCDELFEHVQVTSLQRLGYILEYALEYKLLEDTLYKVMQQQGVIIFRTFLKASLY